MASIGEVAAAIRAAVAEVADADGLIGVARDRYDQAVGLLAAVTDGTGSAEVSVALAVLADAQQRLADACAAVAAATREMEQYLGDIGASSGTDAGPAPAVTAGPQELDEQVRRAAARLPHRRADEESDALGEPRMPTAGIALDDDAGHQPISDTIVSGRGPGSRAPGLDRRQRWGNSLDHVESHVAAQMRADRRLRRVTLVLNNRPCGPDQRVYDARTGEWEPRRYTCDELLASMLPRGTELTVWVRQAGHLRFWRRYIGTGEGVVER